jgi:serine/threonine-protein kinase
MPAKVILSAIDGQLAGRRFVFKDRTTCIVGRANDCGLRIPVDPARPTVSRHHCLLDVNPPDIRIRDFGSRNGTYINGKKIGQRRKGQSPEEATRLVFPEHDLREGDEVRLGNTIFRIGVQIPIYCVSCSAEIVLPSPSRLPGASAEITCQACGNVVRHGNHEPEAPATQGRRCARCGRDVSVEAGQRPGEYICAQCRADPFAVLNRMLQAASTGEKLLVAIDGYDIIRPLGQGGMGAVYLARHERLGNDVALKVMLPQVAAGPNAVDRFLREVQTMRALVHPNIVRLFDSGCYQRTFFLTLEYCNGGSVDKLMRTRGGKLTIDEAVKIVLQVLEGLDYAHRVELSDVTLKDGKSGQGRGLVHRDLKPANIFLCSSPNGVVAKVGDYGLAKAFDLAGLSGHTCVGVVGGTPHFMPRQQVLRFKYAKPEVDVWAAAASLYFMLTGCCPRDFQEREDPWLTVLQTDPVPIRRRCSEIPKRLAHVIDEALIDSPHIKIKSAAELKRAIEGAWQ